MPIFDHDHYERSIYNYLISKDLNLRIVGYCLICDIHISRNVYSFLKKLERNKKKNYFIKCIIFSWIFHR